MHYTENDRQTNVMYDVTILGFKEDGEWCALALEMDLRGYGTTFEEALEDLKASVAMQISFAHFKGETDMISRPAEAKYFRLYERVKQERFRTLASMAVSNESDFAIAGMPLPPAEDIMAQKDAFLAYV